MQRLKKLFIIFFFLVSPILCHGTADNHKHILTNEDINLSRDTEISITTKVFKDYSFEKKCSEIEEKDFKDTGLPYYPGLYDGILWFDIIIKKPEQFDGQRYQISLGNDYIDLAEAFIQKGDSWQLIGRTGRHIKEPDMSLVTSAPLLPLMRELFEENDTTHIRIRMTSNRGNPVNIRLISNTKLFRSTSKYISKFSLSGGIGICLFFGLLLTSILLKDPAYMSLAFSAFFFILRAMHTRGAGASTIWNYLPNIPIAGKLEYILDSMGTLSLAISGYIFTLVNNKKRHPSKTLIAILELVIIELLLTVTLYSPLILFICCMTISVVQKNILLFGAISNLKKSDKGIKIIFLSWSAVFFFSIAFRLLILARNFALLELPDFIKPEEMLTSTIGFLLLFIPPLYSIGKRFNERYQFVQKEYQDLESRFMERDKIRTLIHSVTTPITQLASSVLNSACILSKLNFSSVNAEYVELIKRESSKINDLLVAIRILEGEEEVKKTPILLMKFFNSCMMTIQRTAAERDCTASLTTAIANDTIISADPRVLQLLFIIAPTAVIAMSKKKTKVSIYIEEEKNNLFTMAIVNKFESELLDSTPKILQALNDLSYFDFIGELAKLYDCTMDISPLEDSCRMTFKFRFEKMEDTSEIKIVTDKTTFEISENSLRLLKNKKNTENLEAQNDPLPPDGFNLNLKSEEEKKEQPKINDIFDPYNLSTREKEIATLIMEGNSDKEIAFKLNISPQTVATHNKKIFKKAGVHSRVELINKVR
ncbi:LuxR C-terminal-related transcriptional regulator [Treponema sp.]|uniref:LuxR C-terminal-related transcriptional regulator n=1 Tax=Treponema sp. TaxID=166 RepID=UPI00388F7D99